MKMKLSAMNKQIMQFNYTAYIVKGGTPALTNVKTSVKLGAITN